MIADKPEYMPRRATQLSAGYDVYAPKRMVVTKQWQQFDLGFRFERGDMQPTEFALLAVRSSVGNKKGVHMRTGVSIIDCDYYDNVYVTLCTDAEEVVFEPGDRVLQFIIVPFVKMAEEIKPEAVRNGGQGSTGQ